MDSRESRRRRRARRATLRCAPGLGARSSSVFGLGKIRVGAWPIVEIVHVLWLAPPFCCCVQPAVA